MCASDFFQLLILLLIINYNKICDEYKLINFTLILTNSSIRYKQCQRDYKKYFTSYFYTCYIIYSYTRIKLTIFYEDSTYKKTFVNSWNFI